MSSQSSTSSFSSTMPSSSNPLLTSAIPSMSSSRTPSIAALPSFTHSLSAFPTMTSVTNDMVHYGTLGRNKNVSEAKLNLVLETTKQRRDARPHLETRPPSSASESGYDTSNEDDEAPLLIPRRKQKLSGKGLIH